MARPKHTRTVEPCQIERPERPEQPAPLPTPPPPEEVRAWLDRLLLDGIKATLQVALDALFAACLHAQPYERTDQRQGYRNGSRQRDLLTRCGRVEDIQVPRDREGRFQPMVFQCWQRLEDPLADALRQMYLEGVSTRDVAAITTALCQEDLSASQMSRLNGELRVQLKQWRERPLTDAYPYVYLDAVYEAVNWGGAVTDLAILVAVGVNAEGYRPLFSGRFSMLSSATPARRRSTSARSRVSPGAGVRPRWPLRSARSAPGLAGFSHRENCPGAIW